MSVLRSAITSSYTLPVPSGLTSNWNYGSGLGITLGSQIVTGLLLAMNYQAGMEEAFEGVNSLMQDTSGGWVLRYMHANGACLFFVLVYCHIGRGIYFGSYVVKNVWLSGVVILLLLMGTAFLGYVLPWGQMSFWGATVITNLLSAIPYFGESLVVWVWGGFAVGGGTLTRFMALHFIMPLVIVAMVVLHLLLLHDLGSSNPVGLESNFDKIPFHPYFSTKDMVGFTLMLGSVVMVSIIDPWGLGDPENFIAADPLLTPIHIKPEWYFLFAYAILRSIPNKLGGVVALALSVAMLSVLSLTKGGSGAYCTSWAKLGFWCWIANWVLLTWIGGQPVEDPMVVVGQVASGLYFLYFL